MYIQEIYCMITEIYSARTPEAGLKGQKSTVGIEPTISRV